jgi:hypothetical protein
MENLNLPIEKLGDLDTLQQRLQEEVAASNTVVPWLAPVERGVANRELNSHFKS